MSYVPDLIDENALTIYVDGSMFGSPRRGGIGIGFVWVNEAGAEEVWDESLPATPGANSNQMELEGPSVALELAEGRRAPFKLSRFKKIVVRSDSRYVCDNLNTALYVWSNNGWTTASGNSVLNVADWKRLLTLLRRFAREHRLRVHFEWIPGKKGKHAKAADKLAKESAKSASFGRGRPTLIRRKKTTAQVEVGSVKLSGQVVNIHVIESRHLSQRRGTWRYKYEVVSTDDPSPGAVDWAESRLPLDPGHTYTVRMNAIQETPRIDGLFGEVEQDLTPYVDALRVLGGGATVSDVAVQLGGSGGDTPSRDVVRRRLEQLVERGHAQRTRATSGRRPYVFMLVGPSAAHVTRATT